jgi:membrane-bound lytic murein transglycosylase D
MAIAACLLASSAFAADDPAGPPDDSGHVFPAHGRRSKKHAEEPAPPPAPAVAPAPAEDPPGVDVPAEEAPEDGVSHWVDQMEGEIPTPEQVQAMEETTERELAERSLSDDLSAHPPAVSLYTDPEKSLRPDPLYLDRIDASEFDIPIEVNDLVVKWIRYFTGDGRKYYERWLTRSTAVRPYMYEQLEKAGLPHDLVYLSMIESGYNAQAYSSCGAAGMWQFMPATGKLYKLRIDYYVDERRDLEESTRAAIDMLSELHDMFHGNWYLAWASYNGGPGRVRRATQEAATQDFWTLANGTYLHPETDNYVPKIIAAAIIGHHPERYGFSSVAYQPAIEYDVAHVSGSVELDVLAQCAGTTVDTLRDLNPALRRYSTPPEGYDLKIPEGSQQKFVAALEQVPKSQRTTTTVARHTVRRGETLSTIASKYGVSVSDLSRANGLRNSNKIYVGTSLVIPGHGASVAEASPAERKVPTPTVASKTTPSRTQAKYHTVVRGDNLSDIASSNGVTVTQLKSWNGLSSSTIVPGQRLAVNATGTSSAHTSSSSRTVVASSAAVPSAASSTKYTVRSGDTLGSIAARYHVATSDLQRWNGIANASSIRSGQVLVVKGGSSSSSSASSAGGWTTYTVRSGDSLTKIASSHGCSVQELQSWNGLRGSVIQPGQKLKIKA